MKRVGILSAMQEEIASLLTKVDRPVLHTIGGREFIEGQLWGVDTVIAFSRWGKVASASTVTVMIQHFAIDQLVFTGVAGGIGDEVSVGDVVIGNCFYQHDMDASPIFKKYEIPLVHADNFKADTAMNSQLQKAAETYFKNHQLAETLIAEFKLHQPRVFLGGIASGDQFVSDPEVVNRIKADLPNVLCVEMEGAAVAQVCADFNVPFAIIRTISDNANHDAPMDFLKFVKEVASCYSDGILKAYITSQN